MAPRPVDQNAAPQPPSKPDHAEPTHTAASNPLSTPSVVKTGEVMLIISLVLILFVVVTVTIHFLLKRKKRRRRETSPKKKGEKASPSQTELQSQEKKLAELVGTPLCEMGESEPRHEMEDAEVPERHTILEPESPQENPVLVSPLTPNYDAGIMFGDMSTRTTTQPEAGVYAAYVAR